MNDTRTKNRTIISHMCENWMWELILKKETFLFENRVRFNPLPKSRSQGTSNEKEIMNIKFNNVSMQNRSTFYLLDLVGHSWTMGLNFGGTVLNQPNLIRAKKKDIFIIKFASKFCMLGLICFGRWEIQRRVNIWW